MCAFLTGDISLSTNKSTQLIDDRVAFALASEDPGVVFDLTELGTGKAGKYDAFLEALSKILERDFPPASQERRHGEQTYLPVAISVRDLIDKVKEINPNVPVPSESWILLQFTPKDNRRHAAVNYTSRFNIVYKIQSISHHSNHEDTSFCMSLFKILRSFAVHYRDNTNFFCKDDKHSVNIPEILCPHFYGDGRSWLWKASDPDWHRFKATPSVLLHCDIPESVEESFYSSRIYVTVKDAIFERSTALRHTEERNNIHEKESGFWNPIECIYTDGGPGHYSVRLAHIAHYLKNDLDMLAAACTYPGGSYVDPAERSFTQHCLEWRCPVTDSNEWRTWKSHKNSPMQQAVDKSMHWIDKISSWKSCSVGHTHCYRRISNFYLLSLVDGNLQTSETTKEAVEKHDTFMNWFNAHTRCRRYVFQIKKYMNSPINGRLKQECEST